MCSGKLVGLIHVCNVRRRGCRIPAAATDGIHKIAPSVAARPPGTGTFYTQPRWSEDRPKTWLKSSPTSLVPPTKIILRRSLVACCLLLLVRIIIARRIEYISKVYSAFSPLIKKVSSISSKSLSLNWSFSSVFFL